MSDAMGEMMTGVGLGSVSLSGLGKPLFIGLLILTLGSITAIGIYYLIKFLRYNKKIVLFQRVSGQIMPTLTDKGMFQRIGNAGDFWMVTRQFKKVLPRPKIKMGKNTYWYFEREDGEWINFTIQDIDELMKEAKVYYVDEDMRLQRLGIYKNLEARFNKEGFWQKYGSYIMMGILGLIMVISVVILFKAMTEHWDKMGQVSNAMLEMARAVDNMATRVGGGVVPK